MNNIPTAENFFKEYDKASIPMFPYIYQAMIAFAQLHIKAALVAAADNAELRTENMGSSEFQTVVDRNSILNAYPKENVK